MFSHPEIFPGKAQTHLPKMCKAYLSNGIQNNLTNTIITILQRIIQLSHNQSNNDGGQDFIGMILII